ncbi:MAG: (d)CMP kinase [Planctomycetaceae bacterium]|jgi:cytidylate kinase|nr:(d)CMP kinase [Planctomycetaceae bacterium]
MKSGEEPLIGIITIDGPAGAGKSTVARELSGALSRELKVKYEYIDTGAMYRAATLYAMRNEINFRISETLDFLPDVLNIDVVDGEVYLDGESISGVVRTDEITLNTKYVASNYLIRRFMVKLQQNFAEKFIRLKKGVVTEGRDQGTLAFPNADCKFFLTASRDERARRRYLDLAAMGVSEEDIDLDQIWEDIGRRDMRDRTRKYGGLKKAEDAIEFCTDNKDVEEVVIQLKYIYKEIMKNRI